MAISDGKNKKQKPLDPHQMHFTVQRFLHSCLNMFEAQHIDKSTANSPWSWSISFRKRSRKKSPLLLVLGGDKNAPSESSPRPGGAEKENTPSGIFGRVISDLMQI